MSAVRNVQWSRRARLAVSIATLLAGVPLQAHAASPVAEALFEEGRRLLEAGRTDEACVKLAESLAQEASSGTLLNLALCHETQGHLATAWAEYRAAARLARNQGRADRAEAADERALLLEPKLPRMTLIAEHRVPGMSIYIDESAIGEGALGLAVPIDPGEHRVTASAPGHVAWTTRVTISQAEQRTLEVPALEPQPGVATSAPMPVIPTAVATAPTSPRKTSPAPATEKPAGSGASIAGWIVGGVGVVSLGVATGFGLSSLASYREADEGCPAPHLDCDADSIAARRKAEKNAWISNWALAGGLVAVGVGAYLVFWSSSESPKTVTLRATPLAQGGRLDVTSAF